MRKYPGADGVKTGHTKESGYGLVGSAVRDGRRLILVLNGMKSKAERSRESIKLMDWGFRQFQRVSLYRKGDKVSRARVWGGERNWVKLVAAQDISVRLTAQERKRAEMVVEFAGPLQAPVTKGKNIARLFVRLNGRTITSAPLMAGEDVEKVEGMWSRASDTLLYHVFGG